ncbi:hypothetical protein E3T61_14075 [Cryobacterium lactosi]|uniref:Uncharacterized protein n=1 Tax=Cryobacterium lactosi TaxID=1259202 RepID=A0A4R9BLJ4_9MICO|nr:hypothetical protein [Cryobacterium lactosi]TFD86993.1 hypothetical protein E3T61_14075 [Cryobacterium lactosi]
MIANEAEYLIGIAGVAATLIGAFLVGVFFYIDSEQHRHLTASVAADLYLRAGVQWIFIAFATPLFVSLALVPTEPLLGAFVFIFFSVILVISTFDTGRRIVARGASGSSLALLVNHWFCTAAVIVIITLPWILGGWAAAPEVYVPSMLLLLITGFSSTAALVMSQFDATIGMPKGTDRRRGKRRRSS